MLEWGIYSDPDAAYRRAQLRGNLARGVPEGRLGDFLGTFSTRRAPRMEEAWRACFSLLMGERWCVALIGGFGNGKTHLAIGTVLEWGRRGKVGVFVKVPDWLAMMRAHAVPREGEYSSEEILDNWSICPLLALDDLGVEKTTEWGAEQLYRLLDRRYDARRPTVVTSNARVEELDSRIISRLREGVVICDSPDFRGKQKG